MEYKSVDVARDDCPSRSCFWITERFVSRGYHGSTSRKTEPRCGRRDQTGCPEDPPHNTNWYRTRGVWKEKKK